MKNWIDKFRERIAQKLNSSSNKIKTFGATLVGVVLGFSQNDSSVNVHNDYTNCTTTFSGDGKAVSKECSQNKTDFSFNNKSSQE
ncbi:hypothetical protein [Photobacterium leiognathi]|uniref:hypothetical protein n=1 Tax=Photobacterium leiognathi TaxID=553611 RepID=UPI002734FDEA|nr:hypothetical protein [Photobacterium leiognathi]